MNPELDRLISELRGLCVMGTIEQRDSGERDLRAYLAARDAKQAEKDEALRRFADRLERVSALHARELRGLI